MLNYDKKYKFDFGNPFYLVISYIVEILENIAMIILTWFVEFSLSVTLENLSDCLIKTIILKIIFVLAIIMSLLWIALIFIPKRVIVTDDKILVHRFCFPLQMTIFDIRGLNDTIYYSEIIRFEKFTRKLAFGGRRPFFCINKKSLVEIRTKHKEYLLPIKNADEFIEEVNKRRLACQNDNSNEQL